MLHRAAAFPPCAHAAASSQEQLVRYNTPHRPVSADTGGQAGLEAPAKGDNTGSQAGLEAPAMGDDSGRQSGSGATSQEELVGAGSAAQQTKQGALSTKCAALPDLRC